MWLVHISYENVKFFLYVRYGFDGVVPNVTLKSFNLMIVKLTYVLISKFPVTDEENTKN